MLHFQEEVEEQFVPHPELPNRSGELYPGVEYIGPENVLPFIRPAFHPVPVRLPGIRHRLPASAVGKQDDINYGTSLQLLSLGIWTSLAYNLQSNQHLSEHIELCWMTSSLALE